MNGFINFLKTRYRYVGWWDWLLACYNRVLLRVSIPLPHRGDRCRVRLAGIREPFWARLGTSDFHVLEEIYFKCEYAAVVSHLSEPVKLIVDLGANVGYSLRFWNQHFPHAHIVAVEPDPENAKLCRANVEAGGFSDRVEIIEACVGAHERVVRLESDQGAWALHMVEGITDSQSGIRVKTLTQILNQVKHQSHVDLFKCDIEGAEAEMFGSCESWIQRMENIIVELHPPYTPEQLLKDIQRGKAELTVISVTKSESTPVLFLTRAKATAPVNLGSNGSV